MRRDVKFGKIGRWRSTIGRHYSSGFTHLSPRKSHEIAIGRVEYATVFNRQRRYLSVTNQWPGSATFNQHSPKETPVLVPWCKHLNNRARQPKINDSGCLFHGKTFSG